MKNTGRFSSASLLTAATMLFVIVAAKVSGAETGDFDGDGRITIADVRLSQEFEIFEGVELAEGSFEAFDSYPCFFSGFRSKIAGAVFIESLRRSVSNSLPNYFFLKDEPAWLAPADPTPLPLDPRVRISLENARVQGPSGELEVTVEINTEVPIRALSLMLESDSRVLRPPNVVPWVESFQSKHWFQLSGIIQTGRQLKFDDRVSVPTPATLVTNGRYVIAYGVMLRTSSEPDRVLLPGRHEIRTSAQVPMGTKPADYAYRVLEASQVLLEDGSLVSPLIEDDATIAVEGEILEGSDAPFPELQFDVPNRRVEGAVEFRLTDGEGHFAEDAEPLAVAEYGDVLTLRLQMRTDVPLNQLRPEVLWSQSQLKCRGVPVSLLEHPGMQFVEFIRGYQRCNLTAPPGFASASMSWQLHAAGDLGERNLSWQALEYFRPLGEWVDLFEFQVEVAEGAAGSIPLGIREVDRPDPHTSAQVHLVPYSTFCASGNVDTLVESPNDWNYDVRFAPSYIEVDGGEPVEPPDVGLVFDLASVRGRPGELLAVPVLASAEADLQDFRLVLEANSELIRVESIEVPVRSLRSGETIRLSTERGGNIHLAECDLGEQCTFGVPFSVLFHDTAESHIAIQWNDFFSEGIVYPGSDLVEVATLYLRIDENAPPGEVELLPSTVEIEDSGIRTAYSSGGRGTGSTQEGPYSTPRAIRGGSITVLSEKPFRRGDSNGDGSIDLSDAITTLSYLFLGMSEPHCLDSLDANDSDELDLSDAIFLLGHLFLGGARLPAPSPLCGSDPSVDDLGCRSSPCF